jgi:thioredoxin-like negative regulator of GroEL
MPAFDGGPYRTWVDSEYSIRGKTMQLLNPANYDSFVAAKATAVVHFDAEWDVSGRAVTRGKMAEAEQALGEQVNFGEVDCDRDTELARSIPVLNIPMVAYYRRGKLVAAIGGARQNVRGRLELVMRDQPIGHQDGTTKPKS